MDIQQEKLAIIEWVIRQEKTSDLQKISKIIHQLDKEISDKNKIVGYRSPGVRVSRSELIRSIESSLAEIKAEAIVGLDDVEHDSEQW